MDKEYNIPQFFTVKQQAMINAPIDKKYIRYHEGNAYVGVPVVINILNKVFNHAWSFTAVEQGIVKSSPYINPSKKSPQPQGESSYAWVKGELKVPGIDPNTGETVWIVRQAYGGHPLVGGAKVQCEAFKSAESDALKKAASMLGIAKNVYMDSETYNNIVREEANADGWDQDSYKYFANEIKVMQQFKEGVGEEKMAMYKEWFCDETGDYTTYGEIKPGNIKSFIKYLKDKGLLIVKKKDEVA